MFFVVPKIVGPEKLVLLNWSGRKTNYGAGDSMPGVYDEAVVEAVSYFVKSKLAVIVENDPQQKADYWQDYVRSRRDIMLDLRKQAILGD